MGREEESRGVRERYMEQEGEIEEKAGSELDFFGRGRSKWNRTIEDGKGR